MSTPPPHLPDIVAVDGERGSCPVVTFGLNTRPTSGAPPLLITLTLCEWQRLARRVVEVAATLGC
jgi:hypothetical protein